MTTSSTTHVEKVTSSDELSALKSHGKPIAVFFSADWCEPCVGMSAVFTTLANDRHAKMRFVNVDTDKAADELTERFAVAAVPSFVILSPSLDVLARVEGADAAQLTLVVHRHAPVDDHPATEHVDDDGDKSQRLLDDRLRRLVQKAPVMLFMKGTPDEPKCGFSKKMVALLRKYHDTPFDSFDILSDNEVREGLKKFSNWPTYPQLYADGKLIGGLDIANELDEEGELHTTLLNAVAHKV